MRKSVEALVAAGRGEDARAALSDVLRIAPQDPESWLAAGKLECALGRDQTGLEYVEEAARLDPRSIEANEIARNICVACGLYERALHHDARPHRGARRARSSRSMPRRYQIMMLLFRALLLAKGELSASR